MAMFEKFLKMNGADVGIVFLRQLYGADRHLLGAAARGKEPDPDLHQPHIGLCMGVHRVGMEAGLAPASHDQVVRRGNHRDLRVLDRHHRLLEVLDGHGDVVIGPFGNGHGNKHQVGAG